MDELSHVGVLRWSITHGHLSEYLILKVPQHVSVFDEIRTTVLYLETFATCISSSCLRFALWMSKEGLVRPTDVPQLRLIAQCVALRVLNFGHDIGWLSWK